MGIPAFYRWLVERHPLVVADVIEGPPPVTVNGVEAAADLTLPNPNGLEFDNLYLDMNCIIHPCFHPEGLAAPESYEEVFKLVFKYIDRIFSLIRPRKLLYMAIDGVAPRAKMNQQRSRRFRAAKDAADEASREKSVNGIQGDEELTMSEQKSKMDSNIITPGTEFMSLLSSVLRYYVHLRMNGDPAWKDIKVILSDASVPGEGEHKIMSYIRLQRNLPGFDPNTRHCLYGLDADLIMLALASHEIHFSILRERVKEHNRSTSLEDHSSALVKEGREDLNLQLARGNEIEDHILAQKFQFLHVWVLRDYLIHELRIPDPTVKADFERLIDDFVFMCMFVGNDFLPHVPSLEISEGAIDLLIKVYRKEFVRMGGYLTESWKVNLERVQHFIQAVGSHENAIFRRRNQVKPKRVKFQGSSTHSRAKKFKGSIHNAIGDNDLEIDQVKLGEDGWKERYYAEKFLAKTDDERERIRQQTVLKYAEGISWVMHYYYEGVRSWQWFYPYHYAPFASDFFGLEHLQIDFTLGKPFTPLDQLMAVLPAASAHALPFFYRKLMMDSSSPISDFYPSDFELDMNGKLRSWQAVCKLPFIDESRLLSELAKVEHSLTDEEKQRNSLGLDVLFIHKSHPLARQVLLLCECNMDFSRLHEAELDLVINPDASGGMNGRMCISGETLSPPDVDPPADNMSVITGNKVISVFYKYPPIHPHIPRPPEGVTMPVKSVAKQDVLPPLVLQHERTFNHGRTCDDRPIPKHHISGVRLVNSANCLISRYYSGKQPQIQGYIGGANVMELVSKKYEEGKEYYSGTQPQIQGYSGGYYCGMQPQIQGYSGGYYCGMQPQIQGYSGGYYCGMQPQIQGYSGGYYSGTQSQIQGYSGGYYSGTQPQIQGYSGGYYSGTQPQIQGYSGGYYSGTQPQIQGYSGGYYSGRQPQIQGYSGGYYSGTQPQIQGFSGGYYSGTQPQIQGYSGGYYSGTQPQIQGYSGGYYSGTQPQIQGYSGGANVMELVPKKYEEGKEYYSGKQPQIQGYIGGANVLELVPKKYEEGKESDATVSHQNPKPTVQVTEIKLSRSTKRKRKVMNGVLNDKPTVSEKKMNEEVKESGTVKLQGDRKPTVQVTEIKLSRSAKRKRKVMNGVLNDKPTVSEKEMNEEVKESGTVKLQGDRKPTVQVTEIKLSRSAKRKRKVMNGVLNDKPTVSEKEMNEEVKESGTVKLQGDRKPTVQVTEIKLSRSAKRKRKVMNGVLNDKPTVSEKEMNEEVKESGTVKLQGDRKPTVQVKKIKLSASMKRKLKLMNGILNNKPTVSEKEMNGEVKESGTIKLQGNWKPTVQENEIRGKGIESDATRSKERNCSEILLKDPLFNRKKAPADRKKARANRTVDVAPLPSHKPLVSDISNHQLPVPKVLNVKTTVSEKGSRVVVKECDATETRKRELKGLLEEALANRKKALADYRKARANRSVHGVGPFLNNQPPVLEILDDKLTVSEKKLKRDVKEPESVEWQRNHKPLVLDKEINGEGKGSHVIESRKRKRKGCLPKKALANPSGVEGMPHLSNHKQTVS